MNKYIAPLLTETTVVSIDNQDLKAVYESVEQTKEDFYVALGYNEESGTYREPFGYSSTDVFFISANCSATKRTNDGSLVLPRCGTGAK